MKHAPRIGRSPIEASCAELRSGAVGHSAWLRGYHLVMGSHLALRWLLSTLTLLAIVVVTRLIVGLPLDPQALRSPVAALSSVQGSVEALTAWSASWRALAWACVVAAMLGPVGAWSARAVIAGRQLEPLSVGPSAAVSRRLGALLFAVPSVLLITGVLLPMAGLLGYAIHLSPILAIAVIPVAMVLTFGAAILWFGALATPLVPCAIAIEGCDGTEATISVYNYIFARTVSFLIGQVPAVLLAAIPVAASLYGAPQLPGVAADVVSWLGCGLGLALWLGGQPAVYLTLRSQVDGTPREELWDGDTKSEDKPDDGVVPEPPEPEEESYVVQTQVMLVVLTMASWVLAVEAMGWFGQPELPVGGASYAAATTNLASIVWPAIPALLVLYAMFKGLRAKARDAGKPAPPPEGG